MDHITLGVFSPSVLLDIARGTGRLADAGLQVREVPVPSSPAQFTALRDGEFDAVFTSPDNVLAYRFLTHNPLGELLDVEIVAGIDRGLGLCSRRGPGSSGSARWPAAAWVSTSRTPASPSSATRCSPSWGSPATTWRSSRWVPPRSAPTHYTAAGCDLTVLNAGNELTAQAHGCLLLADVTRLGPYLGTVVARLRDGAGSAAVDRLVAALGETARAIRSGALDGQAGASAARLLDLDPEPAAKHVAVLRDPLRGLISNGAVDVSALNTLVGLRRQFLPMPELDDLTARFPEAVRPGVLVG